MGLDYVTELHIKRFVQMALAEDALEGDHSSISCIPKESTGKAFIQAKQEGVIAGVNLAEKILWEIDSSVEVKPKVRDGARMVPGDTILEIGGNVRSILLAERLMLNCMQRMSGIATLTSDYNKLISGTDAKLLDTRKTTPNFRVFEKWAVIIGGGYNHRFSLSDMIMLKDNHIDYAGGVTQAIDRARSYVEDNGLDLKIEVEVRDLAEFDLALNSSKVDRIMLDNMSCDDMSQAVARNNGRVELEASGGITEQTITAVAETGVDYISVGALTHSYTSIDLSLKKDFK